METRMIAFDMDGTLLDDHKQISERTMNALKRAAEAGIELVPATGRIRKAIPKAVLELPFVRYLITLNGAVVWDVKEEKIIYQRIFDKEQSKELWSYMKPFDAMCDLYANGQGYMEEKNLSMLEEYVYFPEMIQLVKDTREVTNDIEGVIEHSNLGVEKFNMYFTDRALQAEVKEEIKRKFPYVKATTSLVNNVELNHIEADKGKGLCALCEHLGYTAKEAVCFGDGDNDISMLLAAGIGVAMENAEEEVKKQADVVTASNVEDGVAQYIEKLLKQKEGC